MPLGRLVLYAHDLDTLAAFYGRHFGYSALRYAGDRIIELRPPGDGITLLLHPDAKGQKAGQSMVKLVFDARDVAGFVAEARERGLDFGPLHKADGYSFANTKDPAVNSISVSSRTFACIVTKQADERTDP